MHNKKTTIPLFMAVLTLAAYGFYSYGQQASVQYYWTHPTEGTAVHHYIGEQMLIADGDTTTIFIDNIPRGTETHGSHSLAYQYGMTNLFRVAAVDSAGRQGIFSPQSDPWVDDGPPGAPGKPSMTLNK